jgi:hypothetical protein
MSSELYNDLMKRHPELFTPAISIDCEDGWYPIIESWCSLVSGENEHGYVNYMKNIDLYKNEPFTATKPTQIKEKWGTLRIYTIHSNDFVNGATRMAERISDRTCEICGNRGTIRRMSWVRVLCDQHFIAKSLGAPESFMGDNE